MWVTHNNRWETTNHLIWCSLLHVGCHFRFYFGLLWFYGQYWLSVVLGSVVWNDSGFADNGDDDSSVTVNPDSVPVSQHKSNVAIKGSSSFSFRRVELSLVCISMGASCTWKHLSWDAAPTWEQSSHQLHHFYHFWDCASVSREQTAAKLCPERRKISSDELQRVLLCSVQQWGLKRIVHFPLNFTETWLTANPIFLLVISVILADVIFA